MNITCAPFAHHPPLPPPLGFTSASWIRSSVFSPKWVPSPSLQVLLLPEAVIWNSKLALQACCMCLKSQSELGYPALCRRLTALSLSSPRTDTGAVESYPPVKWHWSEHASRGASFISPISPFLSPMMMTFARCSQAFLSHVFPSPSAASYLYLLEFAYNPSISVLISWDFLAWPSRTFFNIPRTNSNSWS